MRKILSIAVLVWTTMAVGCGDTTVTDYCTFDSDCPEEGAQFCVNGICHLKECVEDRDCADALVCTEGRCLTDE